MNRTTKAALVAFLVAVALTGFKCTYTPRHTGGGTQIDVPNPAPSPPPPPPPRLPTGKDKGYW